MNRPYTAQSPYSLTPTERIRYRTGVGTRDFANGAGDAADGADPYADPYGGDLDTDVYPRYLDDGYDPYEPDDYPEDYPDDDEPYLDEAHIDRRWMWIGGVAGVVLFIAVIATSMILSGGDSGSVSATVDSQASALPTPSSAPEPSAAPTPRGAVPPTRSLPPETVTTVTPSAEAPPAPPAAPSLLPPPQPAPPPAAAPGTVTYRVTGNRELIDLVTIIYTDQRGALQTEMNVALPWSKTIVLDPGVTLSSVTATSVRGQLNCSITDAGGNLIASQNSNSIITNCTR
jgi:hypothetical protein